MSAFRGCYPSKTELGGAAQAVMELGIFANYVGVLGSSVPPAATVASALAAALAWRDLRAESDAWDKYVRAQDGVAWQTASLYLDQLKPAFLISLAQNPSLAVQYPGLAQMFNAARQTAKRATLTKKKNAARAASATAATTSTASGAATTAAATSTASGAAATAAEGKTAPTVLINT